MRESTWKEEIEGFPNVRKFPDLLTLLGYNSSKLFTFTSDWLDDKEQVTKRLREMCVICCPYSRPWTVVTRFASREALAGRKNVAGKWWKRDKGRRASRNDILKIFTAP